MSSKLATRGFTMLELMIVVAVIAVIASIAIPSYQDYTRKARRNTALATMLDIAMQQERYRAVRPTYATSFGEIGTVLRGDASGYNPNNYDIGEFYNFSMEGPDPGEYQIYSVIAAATSAGGQNKDTEDGVSCLTLQLRKMSASVAMTTEVGGVIKSPSECF